MLSSDAARRDQTRLLLMYNLTPHLQVDQLFVRPLVEAFDFGRFADHIDAAGQLLPRMVFREEVKSLRIHRGSTNSTLPLECRAMATLAVTPRHDPLLLLDVELGSDSVEGIAEFLFATWRHRAALRNGSQLLTEWLAAELQARGHPGNDGILFGRNVHQSVFPGKTLAQRILDDNVTTRGVSPEVITIVLRGTLDGRRGATLGVQRPEVLNNPGQTFVAHGRGVSLIVGWTEPVENSFSLAALGILNAVAVVHRVRRQAFDALELDRATHVSTTADARSLVARLSSRLSDLQLDLSFSIEAYADTILFPELLVESFHSSLRNVSALSEGLGNTSRIVERVGAVIDARRATLDTATQEYAEVRDRVVAAVIAAGSIFALPPALILAFFGVNSNDVDPSHSMFDLHRYSAIYALAWLPFLALVIIGAIVRHKVRVRIPRV